MDTDVYKLFKAVKAVAYSDNQMPVHIEGCKHSNVPLDSAPCECNDFYWFLQGLYMTDAECSVKLSELQPTDDAEILEKQIRTKRIGKSGWSKWTLVK